MNFKESISIQQLLERYQLELIDDKSTGMITGLNEIHKVIKGDLTFVDTTKYFEKVLTSAASFILINERVDCPEGKCLIYSPNPFKVYNQIALDYFPTLHSAQEAISSEAVIGLNCTIYPHVFIGRNVTIGDNCTIYPNVTIYPNTTIGDNVILQSNSAIGSEAFYYNKQDGEYLKMHTIGGTLIGNNVEIGSNCTVDSGVSGITTIGDGTKLDNQIHIGHGVIIGKNCLLCAQVAIAGKTTIGDNVTIYGKVGISKGLTIGDNAVILASSNVGKNLEGNQRYFGSPAVEARQAMKHYAALKLLPNLMEKLKHLIGEEKRVES
jgi:UDP-3-O-[3-hydroxymyristoyl] glucosamine N-acyltransferase